MIDLPETLHAGELLSWTTELADGATIYNAAGGYQKRRKWFVS